jgi:glycosyltransferase involved in cell wall biosynthesis
MLSAVDGIVHLGSRAHERWAVQREVLAVTDQWTSGEAAAREGLHDRPVMCWHYDFWKVIPPERKSGNRVVCLFHHHWLRGFDEPQFVGAICLNTAVYRALHLRQPGKPVGLVRVGSAADAVPHAVRRHPTRKIRLLLAGNPDARMVEQHDGTERRAAASRKGVELVLPIAERLDRQRYAWVLVGPNWEPQAQELERRGWTVLCPGPLQDPLHYRYFGEGDIFLMLSRLEGGPLTLLEAMGLGLWPIATAAGLAPDVVRDAVNGNLLPAYDGSNAGVVADAAAERIRALDRAALMDAGPRVRASVADYTWGTFKREVEALLARMLASGSGGAPSRGAADPGSVAT